MSASEMGSKLLFGRRKEQLMMMAIHGPWSLPVTVTLRQEPKSAGLLASLGLVMCCWKQKSQKP
jgi:hypothetical protein